MTATTLEFRKSLMDWSAGRLRDFPWRQTTDPYEVLLAEILLAKTPAERVEPIYEELLERYPEPNILANADVENLAELLYPLGLQNQRTRALVNVGEQLAEDGVPADEEQLLELPYVGRYAANATLCFAIGESRAVVDANVVRVYERAFGIDLDATDDEAWEFAQEVVPEENARQYNLALLDFASAVCAPTMPNCEECFFSQHCSYYEK